MPIVRHDVIINIDTAAAFHEVTGVTLPTGAVMLESSLNMEKALTGAGGADSAALVHTTGSPEVFAKSGALIQNSKGEQVETSLAEGVGEQFYIAAMSGVTDSGTLAGSNDADVRVLLRYRLAIILPDS